MLPQIKSSPSTCFVSSIHLQRQQPTKCTELLHKQQIPTYQEAQMALQTFRTEYPWINIHQLVNLLHTKVNIERDPKLIQLVSKSLHNDKSAQLPQIVSRAFIQAGFGYEYFIKQLSKHSFDYLISQQLYMHTIKKVLIQTYINLQQFIKKIQPINDEYELSDHQTLFSVLKSCRENLQHEDLQSLFILMQPKGDSRGDTLPHHKLIKLYSQIHKLIGQEQSREQDIVMSYFDKSDQEESQSSSLKPFWSSRQTSCLVNSYAQGLPLQDISLILKNKYQSQQLSNIANIESQLRRILQAALKRLKQQQELPECIAQGNRFKKLVKLDRQKIQMILELPQASQVRTTLCQFYALEGRFDLNVLICTILSVNQFINKKENEVIQISLMRAKAINSISRQEYAFEGKRRKVLVLKREKKQRKITEDL